MSAVKDHFVSRFEGGQLIQADLSQIEIVVGAQLSEDPTLIKLLRDGRDVHCFMTASVYNESENTITKNDPRRKPIKPGTFNVFYGGGAYTLQQNILEQTNIKMPLEWCKNFIIKFYETFPRVKLWHNYLIEQVELHGQLTMPTGMILKFKKFPAKYQWQIDKGTIESYNPPDIKNHPVQSTAQVIMALWVGRFFRRFGINNRDKYLMINEIHDSLMLDCRPEYLEVAKAHLQFSLDSIPADLEESLGIKMLVPIKGEIKHGASWSDV